MSRRKRNGFYGFPNSHIEAELGVAATSRNFSTLTKIVALVGKGPAGRPARQRRRAGNRAPRLGA